MPTIKIGNKWELSSDQYQWILSELREGRNKDGERTISRKTTYHPNIELACKKLLDNEAKGCESLEDMTRLFRFGWQGLADAIKVVAA